MKAGLDLLKNALLILLLAGCASTAKAPATNTPLQQAIQNKQFVFDAQTVLPTGGTARQIAGERYQVRVSGDSLRSDLPYFGRAYSAPINGEGGLRFTSTQFNYSVKLRKHGSWDVSVQPKDATDLREFLFTISESGSATLRAVSNNRQPISYNGVVRPLQP